MTKILVSNQITISNLPLKNQAVVCKTLTFANRDFFRMQRMGIRTTNEYKYYKIDKKTGDLVIPRGCLGRLKAYLEKARVEADWQYDLVMKHRDFQSSTLQLRDYQANIVDKVVDKHPPEGIILSSTGSGKTVMCLDIINRLQLSATVLVPNTVLLEQWKDESKKFYGITPAIIDANHKEIGPLTIATWQSLSSNPELLERLALNTSILIVDECQGAVTTERKKIMKAFRPQHLFGTTATAERSDALGPAIELLFGRSIAQHEMTQCTPTVEVVRTGVDLPMYTEYSRMVEAQIEHPSRNKLIAGLVLGEMLQGRKVLVLTKRIKAYENLRDILPNNDGMYFIDSTDPGRDGLLASLKTGLCEYAAIFGTTSLLAVGTDIPSLDTLIITCDIKSSVLTVQMAGRILRLFEGKPTPKIIDLADLNHPIFKRQFYERKKVYEKKGWLIKF